MKRLRKPSVSMLLGLIVLAILLSACTWSIGGVAGAGGAVTLIVAALALLLFTGTQTGCDDETYSDGNTTTESDAGDEDEDAYVGPCLSAPADGGFEDDAEIGPCLGAPLEDTDLDAMDEAEIGPCLSPPIEDVVDEPTDDADLDADDADDADTDEDVDADEPDTDFGPCLSPPEDTGGLLKLTDPSAIAKAPMPGSTADRDAVRRRLAALGVLPTDVAQRLLGDDQEES